MRILMPDLCINEIASKIDQRNALHVCHRRPLGLTKKTDHSFRECGTNSGQVKSIDDNGKKSGLKEAA